MISTVYNFFFKNHLFVPILFVLMERDRVSCLPLHVPGWLVHKNIGALWPHLMGVRGWQMCAPLTSWEFWGDKMYTPPHGMSGITDVLYCIWLEVLYCVWLEVGSGDTNSGWSSQAISTTFYLFSILFKLCNDKASLSQQCIFWHSFSFKKESPHYWWGNPPGPLLLTHI